MLFRNKLYWVDVGCWMVGWMDVGWLEKAELKPTQPSWSWSWAELVNCVAPPLVEEVSSLTESSDVS